MGALAVKTRSPPCASNCASSSPPIPTLPPDGCSFMDGAIRGCGRGCRWSSLAGVTASAALTLASRHGSEGGRVTQRPGLEHDDVPTKRAEPRPGRVVNVRSGVAER